jgi:hypothetical protein
VRSTLSTRNKPTTNQPDSHSMHTACTQHAHSIHTACTQHAHSMHIACTQHYLHIRFLPFLFLPAHTFSTKSNTRQPVLHMAGPTLLDAGALYAHNQLDANGLDKDPRLAWSLRADSRHDGTLVNKTPAHCTSRNSENRFAIKQSVGYDLHLLRMGLQKSRLKCHSLRWASHGFADQSRADSFCNWIGSQPLVIAVGTPAASICGKRSGNSVNRKRNSLPLRRSEVNLGKAKDGAPQTHRLPQTIRTHIPARMTQEMQRT